MIKNMKIVSKTSELIQFELNRLKSKGFGIIGACSIFYFYFILFPDLISVIWPALLQSFTEIQLFILSVIVFGVAITALYSGIMYIVYTRKYAFLQKYRISKESWPWETNKEAWMKTLKKTIAVISFNTLVLGPILLYFDCQRSFKIKMSLADVPDSKLTYVWQFCFFLICSEIWNFLMHALIHQKKLYWIHKMHHQYNISVCIAGLYVHPIQYIISSTLSTSLGYKIITQFYPVHIFSIMIWLMFRLMEINDSHCGYSWPWAQSSLIPFNTADNYHYFHHRTNVGNYSNILYFMDSICGTNKEYWKYESKVKQKNLKANSELFIYGKN